MKTPDSIEVILQKLAKVTRKVYVASPFVVYVDEMERCYAWFWQRCEDAQMHRMAH